MSAPAASFLKTKQVQTMVGRVVSNKMQKSIVVKVDRRVVHPLYNKEYKKSKKYIVHDENNVCQEGDVVEFSICPPLSKRKSWMLNKVITQAGAPKTNHLAIGLAQALEDPEESKLIIQNHANIPKEVREAVDRGEKPKLETETTQ